MNIILCLSEDYGMLFNKRRLSYDREIIKEIKNITEKNKLYMNSYSFNLFKDYDFKNIVVDENFLENANENDFCFIEDKDISDLNLKINKIYIFNFQRSYPYDLEFKLPLSDFKLTKTYDIKGYSHDKITLEVLESGNKKI